MPALTVTSRSQANDLSWTMKRSNWASREPGVVLVFCIVFIVALGIAALFAYRKWMAWKVKKQKFETTT